LEPGSDKDEDYHDVDHDCDDDYLLLFRLNLVQYDVDGIGCNAFFSYDQHLSIHICIISIYLSYIHIYTHLFIYYVYL